MSDILSVDLKANNAEQAISAVERYKSSLVSADKLVNEIGSRSQFARGLDQQIAETTSRINTFRSGLRDVAAEASRSGTGLVRGFGVGADQAAAKARGLLGELREIQAQSARAVPGFPLFDSLQRRAAQVNNELDNLERKAARVASGRGTTQAAIDSAGVSANARFQRLNLARQGADVFTQVGSGQSAGLIAIQQGPQILEALAGAGLKVGIAGAAAAAGIAAVGAAIIAVTSQMREAADKQLAIETQITVEWSKRNKAIDEQKKKIVELNQEFEKFLTRQQKLAQSDPALRQALGDLPVQLAQRNVNQPTLAQLKDLNTPLNEAVKQNQADFKQTLQDAAGERRQQLDRFVNSLQSDIAAAASKGDRNALEALQKQVNFHSSQFTSAQRLDFRAQFEKAFAEVVENGKKKAKELGETWQSTFRELFAQRGANNPFVRVFTEADAAIEKVRISTAALSADLRAQAEEMQRTANANALFSARLDNALSVSDLGADAERFRRGGRARGTAQADAQLAAAVARRQAEETGGLFRNPATLSVFANGVSAASRLQFFDFQRQQERASGLFRNPQIEALDRERLQRDAAAAGIDKTVQERLDRQLEVIGRLRPENAEQRSEVDRKIIALTQGLNPEDLTETQRNAAAAARENEAARAAGLESAAKEQKAAEFKVQQSIEKNIAELVKIAQSEGLSGVVRIINEAEDRAKVSLGKRPKPADTASAMGLTN